MKRKNPTYSEVKELLQDELEKHLQEGGWAAYLNVMRSFSNYSANNALWIVQQQRARGLEPNCQLATYPAWKTKYNRRVKTGSKGLKYWLPIKEVDEDGKTTIKFRIGHLFDSRDTEGDPIPEKPKVSPMAQLNGEVPESLFEALSHVACSGDRRIAVRRNVSLDQLGGAHGLCRFNGMGNASLIEIGAIKPASQASTFCHELAHAMLHSPEEYKEHLPTSIKELEAEATAYLCMLHYNIETNGKAFDYILDWQKKSLNAKQVKTAMLKATKRIFETYRTITSTADAYLEGEGV